MGALHLRVGLAFPSGFIRRNDVQNWINFSIKHAAWTWGNAACGNHSLRTQREREREQLQPRSGQARPG